MMLSERNLLFQGAWKSRFHVKLGEEYLIKAGKNLQYSWQVPELGKAKDMLNEYEASWEAAWVDVPLDFFVGGFNKKKPRRGPFKRLGI